MSIKEYVITSLASPTSKLLKLHSEWTNESTLNHLSLKLQPNSQAALSDKYLMKTQRSVVETTKSELIDRVSQGLADINPKSRSYNKRKSWYRWMMNMGGIPAGRILSVAGTGDLKTSTSPINCVVSNTIYDSLDSIFMRLKESALTQQSGTGIGYAFHALRPSGAWVDGVNAKSSGPESFAEVYDKASGTIASDGGRRGAQMLTCHIQHPDAEVIYSAKRKDGKLRNFNISVLVPDDFIKAVREDLEIPLIFPASLKEIEYYAKEDSSRLEWHHWMSPEETDRRHLRNEKGEYLCLVYDRVSAKDRWNRIMESAWYMGEPGVLYIDTINRMNNLWFCETIWATNPCGEQPLPPNGSCLLGSINLAEFVANPFTDEAHVDWNRFRLVARLFHEALDNVVDINRLPIEAQRKSIESTRRHGAGLMGLGTAANMLKLSYESDEFKAIAEQANLALALEGLIRGQELATEKGPAPVLTGYVTYDSIDPHYLELIKQRFNDKNEILPNDKVKAIALWLKSEYLTNLFEILTQYDTEGAKVLRWALWRTGCRYSHWTSLAPTGTIALSMGNNSSNGIEPSFAHSTLRNVIVEGRKTKLQIEIVSAELLAYRRHAVETGIVTLYSINEEDIDPPQWFQSAYDITVEGHLKIMAAAQPFIDSSISKTINLPPTTTVDEMTDVYLRAFDLGLKGCTVFRPNPEVYQSVLNTKEVLNSHIYEFTMDDGTLLSLPGGHKLIINGEETTAGNLYDALKENKYDQ